MPVYVFACHQCDAVFEERRSFAAAGEPATCPECASTDTRKQLTAVGFISGDSRASSIPVPFTNGGGCCGGACGCGH